MKCCSGTEGEWRNTPKKKLSELCFSTTNITRSGLVPNPCVRFKVGSHISVHFIWRTPQRMLTVQLSSWLIPWSGVPLEILVFHELFQEFSSFFETWSSITELPTARHLSLSWARANQITPLSPISWKSILILSHRVRLGLLSGTCPSGFSTNSVCTFLAPIHATCAASLVLQCYNWKL